MTKDTGTTNESTQETREAASPREQIHASLGHGIRLLDRLHFLGLADFDPDDYARLADVPRQLRAPYTRQPDPTGELFADVEKEEIFREALGTETRPEAVSLAANAAVTIEHTINGGVEATTIQDFYNAQDIVRALWRATMPTEFSE